ncbi:N-acetylmuramoyl-L-alanine amidase CwlH precursor [Slackia heliotrinireducens]|uniref:N-acetylmuramoyl-L-alanine amidase n=1 Tax=Slackia heliotrinireducens (strain ATCC 29202 / DSM 20476 / NCTC 11029 / RHS 1) TaxID=471855 RepID=C7N6M2_SLAHD|nr:peptidoglycan recognition family protein [Slackia heliotrinireducens]ACV22557.1 N-acetylmuramoyl-L-alanine amidase [Slackia heliotrinireducens DSM 20476]VEH01027.1 N-acetylmuramoyl-L-alanine amidase CwlH precursor [Slackia heliotrinireducens]
MSYEINKHHGSYNIQPRSASAVKYIVVHYTGSGTSAAPAALNNCQYFSGGDRQASAHYFIDDETIYEYADPSRHLTWHVGDGRGKYGITNTNSIGIEVCQDGDRPFTEAETKRLQWLVRRLMDEYGVPADRVVRHYDASRKLCPYYYTPGGSGGDAAWKALHRRITADGASKAGWVKSAKGWWYRRADGTWPASKWERIGGDWYCFDKDGYAMADCWKKSGGKWYWLRGDCRMAKSTVLHKDGRWYALGADGAMLRSVATDKSGALRL